MLRAMSSLAAGAILLGFASTASAISIRVTELSGCWFTTAPEDRDNCFGTPLSIGVRISEKPGDSEIAGMGLSIHSYGSNEFIGGSAVDAFFVDFADPDIGAFGGLQNLAGGALQESAVGANGNRVQFALALRLLGNTPPVTPPPGLDPGLDGVIGGGDAMFRFQFRIYEDALFRIGTTYQGDGVINRDGTVRSDTEIFIDVGTNSIPIVILPEPNTALLLGLGLVALSGSRRRPDTILDWRDNAPDPS